jgi:hypothetical protein
LHELGGGFVHAAVIRDHELRGIRVLSFDCDFVFASVPASISTWFGGHDGAAI